MLSCQEVAQLVSESLDSKLLLRERLAVKIHFLFCKGCPQFEQQVRFLRDTLRTFQVRIESTESFFPSSLGPEARDRIKRVLGQAASDMASEEM